MNSLLRSWFALALGLLVIGTSGCGNSTNAPNSGSTASGSDKKEAITLLNVSYDPTRELYADFNNAFAEHWKKEANQDVEIEQSHGGSGSQSRKVSEGLEADVVTLALAYDIDAIAKKDFINKEWQKQLASNSAPYTSTIVFMVRKGNPKNIKDWEDLGKGDVQIITPNPKTGGGARWNYLAAWGSVLKKELGDLKKLNDPAAKEEVTKAQEKAKAFVTELSRRVTVWDASARASTTTFTRGTGDLLIGWENEAFFILNSEQNKDKYEVIVPSISILAEPPVAIVDKNVDKKGTRKAATAYLEYLYTKEGQQIIAKHYYRPIKPELVSEKERNKFLKVELFGIDEVFGGWNKAQAEHFNDGGIYDQILKAIRQ
jgi:sulfate/thiosulfate transport system substrate-binding protein